MSVDRQKQVEESIPKWPCIPLPWFKADSKEIALSESFTLKPSQDKGFWFLVGPIECSNTVIEKKDYLLHIGTEPSNLDTEDKIKLNEEASGLIFVLLLATRYKQPFTDKDRTTLKNLLNLIPSTQQVMPGRLFIASSCYHAVATHKLAYFEDNLMRCCVALEALFSTSNQEVTFLLATRVAWFLGKDKKKRASLFNSVKKLYDLRSRFAHGEVKFIKLTRDNKKNKEILIEAANLVRTSLVKILLTAELKKLYLHTKEDKVKDDLNQYFTQLCLGNL